MAKQANRRVLDSKPMDKGDNIVVFQTASGFLFPAHVVNGGIPNP